jgi:peptidoglycan/xylan/chitin deacetylase (PgdA/CDA1 family)
MSEPLLHRLRRGSVEWGLLGPGGAGKARVLMYHGIGEAGCHRVNVRHLSTELFERHLKLFTAHFNVVPLQDLLHGARHPDKLTVALTFDDGLRNNRTHALPLLEKYQVPAAFFITGANPCGLRILWGDLLDLGERHTDQDLQVSGRTWRKNEHGRYAEHGNGLLLRDHIKQSGVWGPKQDLYDQLGALVDGPLQADRLFWELMSDDELRRFTQHPFVTLGSHGWWHNDMGRIPPAQVTTELTQSRDYLTEISGAAPSLLAWPSGSYGEESVRIAASVGFTQQLAVDALLLKGLPHGVSVTPRYGMYDFPVRDRWLRYLIARNAA